MSKIKINDGLKTYDIVNQDDKLLGQFSFNPSDTGFIRRYEDVIAEIDKKVSETPDNEMTEEENIKFLLEFEDYIKEKVDYIFNSNISETFFSIMGACTPLPTGNLFYTEVLNAIGGAIQMETGTRVKKVSSKVQKYTSKYN